MTFQVLSDFGISVLEAFKNIVTVLTTNIDELSGLFIDNRAVQWIIDKLSFFNPLVNVFGGYSIMEIMFTSGVATFLVVMIIKWLIGIIT